MRKLFIFIPLLGIAFSFLEGCSSGKAVESYQRTTAAYAMAPLDEAHVVRKGGDREIVTISPDGKIDLNGASRYVKGMPVDEFRSLVQKSFPSAGAIEIVEFRPNRVTILGEVFHQIHADLGDGPLRVMDAIALANGFTPLANKRRVRVLRENAGVIEVFELDLREMMKGGKLDQNILLEPGDTVTVPRNFL